MNNINKDNKIQELVVLLREQLQSKNHEIQEQKKDQQVLQNDI